MIIISQNKEKIINFDNVCVLELNRDNPKEIISIANSKYIQLLGIYATEERAKEVLMEIVKYASINKINEDYYSADLRMKLAKACRYEMPEE